MRINNSLVSFYGTLFSRLHDDIAARLHVRDKTLTAEKRFIARRLKKEGLSFLTKTLPAYGKAVDLALSSETQLNIVGLKKAHGAALPKFLGWLLSCVFDHTGRERTMWDEYSTWSTLTSAEGPKRLLPHEALAYFRQLVYLVYKLRVPSDPDNDQAVIEEFAKTDAALQGGYNSNPKCADVLMHARRFTSSVFGTFDEMDIKPSHGPGSVATGERAEEKASFKRIYSSVERKYPFTEYFMFNLNHVVDKYPELQALEPSDQPTAKVVLVPKDSRGQRLISCEPLEIQWIQQGLARKMVAHLERHRLTAGHVNFTDQSINQRLALDGSAYLSASFARSYYTYSTHSHESATAPETEWLPCVPLTHYLSAFNRGVGLEVNKPTAYRASFTGDPVPRRRVGQWVTLDMKEASDRVSLDLVKEVFALVPGLLEALVATRSTHTRLPSGAVIALKKFAPMGSALCFPVESFVFYALAVGTLIAHKHYTRREACSRVYVYGDDLIVDKADYACLLATFPQFELKFNEGKCCTHGSFRESCGVEAYRGFDVTPVRLRTVWSDRRVNDPKVLLSYVSFGNEMVARGFHGVANYIWTKITHLYGFIPYTNQRQLATFYKDRELDKVELACSGVMRYTAETTPEVIMRNFGPCQFRWNSELHRLEVRSYGVRARKVPAPTDGYHELLRRYCSGASGGGSKEPWGLYAVRHRSRLQRRWVACHYERDELDRLTQS